MLSSISVPLHSHYFDISSSRCVNTFSKSTNFSSQRLKSESLEVRLSYEYKYCVDYCGGQVFYYTLTFNNHALPYFMGKACHDYNIIREFINGGFYRKLERNFNLKLRYFISAECGEGGASHHFKGSRGKGHNPHYHVIFFLYPLVSNASINPYAFLNLVREYWQGKDGMLFDTVSACRSSLCKYGYACPGTQLGIVSCNKALRYVAKYVNKEESEYEFEDKIYSESLNNFRFSDLSDLYKSFLTSHNLICSITKLSQRLINKGLLSLSEVYEERIKNCGFFDDWLGYIEIKAHEYAKKQLLLFRNRFSSKVRYSHGLGWHLGKQDIEKNLLDPKLYCDSATVPNKERPVSLYYKRKIYYTLEKDVNGNNLYILNALGRKMMLNKFNLNFDKSVNKIKDTINFFKLNPVCISNLVNKYNSLGEVVPDVLYIRNLINSLNCNVEYKGSIFERYYLYKRIYENRFTSNLNCVISPSDDLFRYLHPCFYYSQYSDELVNVQKVFNKIKDYERYYSFSLHPYFSSYIDIFNIFDLLVDYKNYISDKKDKELFDKNQKVIQFHLNKKFQND